VVKRQSDNTRALKSGAARCGLLIASAVLVTACTLVSVNDTSHYTDAEGRIPESLLLEIQPHRTNRSWIYTHFGEPLNVLDTVSGQEVFTYPLTRVHRKDVTLLFLVRYRGVERKTEYFHVAFEGDLVSNHWIDELPLVQVAPAKPEGLAP
jgi:hypothetical protein